jgi:zinc protease
VFTGSLGSALSPWELRSMSRYSPAATGSLTRFAELPILEEVLDNGLRVLVWERHESPIVLSDLYFSVGSVNDPAGQSGMAHFVEHMLFKGTRRFPKGGIDRLTFLAGGQANAETDEDTTHYWFALPADAWELPLALESDRMRHARFAAEEVEVERRVIAEEARRELDQPWVRLERAHLAACYPAHPYRNPVLGWAEHLEGIGSEDLRRFYRTHYRAGGATLVVVGAVSAQRLLDRVRRHFGGIPAGRTPPALPPVERLDPTLPQRIELREAEFVTRGLLGWRTCPRSAADTAALDVLAELLGSGRHSRLWRRLVDGARCATSADATHEPSLRDGLLYVAIEGEGRAEPERIEAAVGAEIEELSRRGPSASELDRVRRRLHSAWLWELDDLGAVASGLGHAALTGDWRVWPSEYRAALAIRPDDIRRVVRRYLDPSRVIAAWSVPHPDRVSLSTALEVAPEQETRLADGRMLTLSRGTDRVLAGLLNSAQRPHESQAPIRQVMPNGMRLIGEPRPDSGVLALEFHCDGGILREEQPGTAFLTARMREEGTRGRSGSSIARLVEQAGGTLEVMPAGISLRIGAESLALAVELLADLVRRPSFPARSFAWTRRRLQAELKADREDPAYRAGLEFLRLLYGRHPYGRDPRGTIHGLSRLDLEDVRRHQARWFTPDRSFLVVAGDFSWPRLIAAWKAGFGDWPASRLPIEPPRRPRTGRAPRRVRVTSNGTQVHIVMGHLGIERTHPDFPALAVLDHILGCGPGLSDRLSRTLREELGLVYSVTGGITETADVVPGMFRITLAAHHRDAARAVAAAERELRAVQRGEFSDREVEDARRYLGGAWVFEYQSVSQRAERWLELERWGLPLDEPATWPERIGRVTADEVRRAAQTHLHPDQMVRVEYGPGAGADSEGALV